jgi:hypothetical protein
MQKSAVSIMAWLAGILLGVSPVLAQRAAEDSVSEKASTNPKAEKPAAAKSLADLLAEALKSNPDIRVAEAKLQEASAELERARLKVTQKVVAAYHALQTQKAEVGIAEASVMRVIELMKKGAIPQANLDSARQQLILAKAKLTALEGELPYLLGKSSLKSSLKKDDQALAERYRALLYLYELQLARRAWNEQDTIGSLTRQRPPVQAPRGTVAVKLKKALDKPVTLKFEKAPLVDVLKFLEEKVEGVTFRVVNSNRGMEKGLISLELKEVPLGAVIQAIQDSTRGLRFVVRDYGVLVTWEDRLPPRALLLEDFWEGEAGKEKAKNNAFKKP